MKIKINDKAQTLLSVFSIFLIFLAASIAAANDNYSAPELKTSAPWAAITYTAVAVIAILVVAFKNARRTHLD